jgi:FAD dependent oxidoreductase TIGR03364
VANAKTDVAIVGAGILGLAHAYESARRGLSVRVVERTSRAVGASVRNFGTIWPIGLSAGKDFERALFGRSTWLQLSREVGISCDPSGSLHLAYSPDEWAVLAEYAETLGHERGTSELLNAARAASKSPGVRTDGLLGGLWSATELTIYPLDAVRQLAAWLADRYGVRFHFSTAVTRITERSLTTSAGTFDAERIFVCAGSDLDTLYPEQYAASGITRCKLQMLRTVAQPSGWRLGPILCGGLTLLHYDAFRQCASLPALQARYEHELPDELREHIHVLVAQTPAGELTIGDSHEYGSVVDPFDRETTNRLILAYLQRFARVPTLEIAQRWHGVYPKIPGRQHWRLSPDDGVLIASVFGLGMTLSFGLARDNLDGTPVEE